MLNMKTIKVGDFVQPIHDFTALSANKLYRVTEIDQLLHQVIVSDDNDKTRGLHYSNANLMQCYQSNLSDYENNKLFGLF